MVQNQYFDKRPLDIGNFLPPQSATGCVFVSSSCLFIFSVLLLFTCCGRGACCQGDGEGKAEGGKKKKGHEKKLKNQFNFSERASQTYNYPLRVSASLCVCFTMTAHTYLRSYLHTELAHETRYVHKLTYVCVYVCNCYIIAELV